MTQFLCVFGLPVAAFGFESFQLVVISNLRMNFVCVTQWNTPYKVSQHAYTHTHNGPKQLMIVSLPIERIMGYLCPVPLYLIRRFACQENPQHGAFSICQPRWHNRRNICMVTIDRLSVTSYACIELLNWRITTLQCKVSNWFLFKCDNFGEVNIRSCQCLEISYCERVFRILSSTVPFVHSSIQF